MQRWIIGFITLALFLGISTLSVSTYLVSMELPAAQAIEGNGDSDSDGEADGDDGGGDGGGDGADGDDGE